MNMEDLLEIESEFCFSLTLQKIATSQFLL